MINTNDYIGLLFSIITASVFEFLDKKKKKSSILVWSSILIIILTIVYKFDIIIFHIESLFSNYTFTDSILIESKFDKLFSIIVVSLFIHLFMCYFFISKCIGAAEFFDIKFDIIYFLISILFSFFITLYLHLLSSYLIMNKLYILINNENTIAILEGFFMFAIMFFESWVLFRINLYLSLKNK